MKVPGGIQTYFSPSFRFVLTVPGARASVLGGAAEGFGVVELISDLGTGGAMGFGVTTGITSAEGWAAQPRGRRPHRVVRDLGEILQITAEG